MVLSGREPGPPLPPSAPSRLLSFHLSCLKPSRSEAPVHFPIGAFFVLLLTLRRLHGSTRSLLVSGGGNPFLRNSSGAHGFLARASIVRRLGPPRSFRRVAPVRCIRGGVPLALVSSALGRSPLWMPRERGSSSSRDSRFSRARGFARAIGAGFRPGELLPCEKAEVKLPPLFEPVGLDGACPADRVIRLLHLRLHALAPPACIGSHLRSGPASSVHIRPTSIPPR